MKKRGLFILFAFLVLIYISSSFILGVDPEGLEQGVDKIKDSAEGIKSFTEEDKWDYLSEQWKSLLLRNDYVAYTDNLLKKFSIGFLIILGQGYELSFTFFMVLILWIFMFFILAPWIRDYSSFSVHVSDLIALGLTIIAAQIGFLRGTSDFLFKIIFYRSGIWSWVSFFFVMIGMGVVFALIRIFRNKMKERKKSREETIRKADQRDLHTFAEAVRKGSR